MSVEMTLDGCVYEYSRDKFSGVGNWTVAKGSCPELIGHNNAGLCVPVIFDAFLTSEAQERGIAERYNFSKTPPEPVKEVRVKGPKKPRARPTSIRGGGLRLSLIG